MTSQLGPVGTVLSVAFALFITVLFVKLWYLRGSRQRLRESVAVQAPALKKQVQVRLGRARALKARSVCLSSGNVEGKASESWAKTLAMWCGGAGRSEGQAEGEDEQKQERSGGEGDVEEAVEEEDVLSLGGLWGVQRLLFTIREETMEEMQVEEARCNSHEKPLLILSSSGSGNGSGSPFVTPPSSPPFATPFGSPALISDSSALPFRTEEESAEPDSGSSASSSSTSSSSSSPVLQGGRPPSLLFFEDTASSSSSPAPLSPTAVSPVCSSADKPIFLQDPPCSPPSLLTYNCHTNRVYPLNNTHHLHGSCNSENELKPLSPDEPSWSFHLPPLSQPSTPCPFRPSLFAKAGTQGVASSPALLRQPRFFPIR